MWWWWRRKIIKRGGKRGGGRGGKEELEEEEEKEEEGRKGTRKKKRGRRKRKRRGRKKRKKRRKSKKKKKGKEAGVGRGRKRRGSGRKRRRKRKKKSKEAGRRGDRGHLRTRQTDPVHKTLCSAVSRHKTSQHYYYDYCGTSIWTCNTSTHPGLMQTAANSKLYKRTHLLLFTGSGGSNAARIASSKTFFNPFWKPIKTRIKHNLEKPDI
jgi:hypothetical protein